MSNLFDAPDQPEPRDEADVHDRIEALARDIHERTAALAELAHRIAPAAISPVDEGKVALREDDLSRMVDLLVAHAPAEDVVTIIAELADRYEWSGADDAMTALIDGLDAREPPVEFDALHRIHSELEDRGDEQAENIESLMIAAAAREGRTDFHHDEWAKHIAWRHEDAEVVAALLRCAVGQGAAAASYSGTDLSGMDEGDAAGGLYFWMKHAGPIAHPDPVERLIWFSQTVVPDSLESGAVDSGLRDVLTELICDWIGAAGAVHENESRVRAYHAFVACDWRNLLDSDYVEEGIVELRRAAGLPDPDGEDDDESDLDDDDGTGFAQSPPIFTEEDDPDESEVESAEMAELRAALAELLDGDLLARTGEPDPTRGRE